MNTTVTGTNCAISFNSAAAKIAKTVGYCLIFIVSLLGNSFVGIIVCKTQTLRKPINFFIVSMAISDLLYPIFLFPPEVVYLFSANSWLLGGALGQALCKMVPFLVNVSSYVSIQSLVLMAVDRFGAAVFPLRSPLISPKLCTVLILATWIFAMAAISPDLFTYKLVAKEGQLFCENRWSEVFGESFTLRYYVLADYVVLLYIPLGALVILYTVIVVKLKSQTIPGEQLPVTERVRKRRNRNVLKMVIAIVSGFSLCWIPWSIIILLNLFAWDGVSTCSFNICFRIVCFMVRIYCAIYPFICFIFSGNYRAALKRFLKCSRTQIRPINFRLNKRHTASYINANN